jgi:DNA-binding CsgD family transcriptional regulator
MWRSEVEVLRLVADGLTTRDVAVRLFISAKTADRHIPNISTKIGTSMRATATRWSRRPRRARRHERQRRRRAWSDAHLRLDDIDSVPTRSKLAR